MADKDLKSATPDTSLPTDGFLFGADSQSATDPSVYPVSAVGTTLLGSTALTGATVTTSSPVLNLTQTWNGTSSTLFYGARINISTTPNTTSDYSSPLFAVQINSNNAMVVGATSGVNGGYAFLDLRVNSSSPLYSSATIADNGTLTGIGNGRTSISLAPTSLIYLGGGATSFRLAATTSFGWSTSPSDTASDLQLTRAAAATLQLGAADTTGTTAPTAQFLRVQSWSSSTNNNQTGANFTIQGSRGTGTGAGGSIIFQVAPAGSSGTAQNAYSTALTLASDKSATFGGVVSLPPALWHTSTDGIQRTYYVNGSDTYFKSGGSFRLRKGDDTDTFIFSSTGDIYFQKSGGVIGLNYGGSNNVILAPDAANTLALKNSTNPQIFRAYSTTTGPSYGYFASGVTDAGVATADTLFIGTGGVGAAMTKLNFVVNGTSQLDYNVTVNGPVWYTVNTFYVGQNSGLGFYNRLYMASGSSGNLLIQNWSGTDFGRLQFGGTTSSFPALKRISSGNCLQVIAADNTASAGFIVGNQALATTATDGFIYVPTCAGTPTGTPTTQTGTAPIIVDTTNNKLYFYSGGQWRDAGP